MDHYISAREGLGNSQKKNSAQEKETKKSWKASYVKETYKKNLKKLQDAEKKFFLRKNVQLPPSPPSSKHIMADTLGLACFAFCIRTYLLFLV